MAKMLDAPVRGVCPLFTGPMPSIVAACPFDNPTGFSLADIGPNHRRRRPEPARAEQQMTVISKGKWTVKTGQAIT